MPCDTIRTTTLDLAVADRSILERGLKAAGFEVRSGLRLLSLYHGDTDTSAVISLASGTIEVPVGREELADRVKRAYATEAVRTASQRFGFTVKADAKNPQQHLTLSRRTF